MDRFTEESTADLAAGYAARMKQEFNYLGCETCYDEAMEIIARETAIRVLRLVDAKVAKLTAPEFQKEEVA